jgi:hypothetical protein
MMGRFLATVASLALLVGVGSGCSSSTDAEDVKPDSIGAVTLLIHHLTTVPGAWIQVPTRITDTTGRVLGAQPQWTSTAPTVATVDMAGAIRVLASGAAHIVARYGSRTDTLRLEAAPVRFTDVSVGFEAYTCGVTITDDVFCWGGVGLFDSLTGEGPVYPGVRAPVKVARLPGLQRLTTGATHLCTLVSGTASCWGSNTIGMLGLGTIDSVFHPEPATVPGFTFTELSAGGFFTCGLVSGGDAYCWGYNGYGELGDSSSGTIRPTPVRVRGGTTFQALATGLFHACGLEAGGVVHCWGSGFGTVPVPVDTSLRFSAVDTRRDHTCGIATGGAAWCWGYNGSWQLGSEAPGNSSDTPVMVGGNHLFSAIVTGAAHSCGLTAAGTAWCWGEAGAGQLGNGQVGGRSSTPVVVAGGHTFSLLHAGGAVTCGLTTGGRLYCWGSNYWGEIGDGTDYSVQERSVPTEVAGQQQP